MQTTLPQIKPGLMNGARVESTPYNLGLARRKSSQFSYSDIKHKIHSTRNGAVSLGDRMPDAHAKSLTARYNS